MCNKNKSDICDFWVRFISAYKSVVYMDFSGGGKFFCKTHFFEKNLAKYLVVSEKSSTFAPNFACASARIVRYYRV